MVGSACFLVEGRTKTVAQIAAGRGLLLTATTIGALTARHQHCTCHTIATTIVITTTTIIVVITTITKTHKQKCMLPGFDK